MRLLRACLPRRLPLKKLMLAVLAMFIFGWVTVLLIQSSAEGPKRDPGVEKLPFPFLHPGPVPTRHKPHIQLNESRHGAGAKDKRTDKPLEVKDKPHPEQRGKITPRVLLNVPQHPLKNVSNLTSTVGSVPSITAPQPLEQLRLKLLALNREERVLNADKYPSPGELVLIVQAHKRVAYLQQLLESLRAVKGIHKVLLVVSHDHYSEEMNQAVQTVDFCKVCLIPCVFCVRPLICILYSHIKSPWSMNTFHFLCDMYVF